MFLCNHTSSIWFHKDLLNFFRVIAQTNLKIGNFTNSRADNSTSHEQISPKFELDLCFYDIILVLKFQKDLLNFVREIAPTTLKMGDFDKFRGR